jgi:hypothetical protein
MDKQTALDELSQAVSDCKAAGLQLSVTPMYGESVSTLALFMTGEVRYGSGKFYISDGQIWSRSEERVGIRG